MATEIEKEIHEKTHAAVEQANETLITLATSLYGKLQKLPLHTHVGVMKVLDAMTENRHQTMQLEAMEQQKKAQEAFQAERKAADEALKAARQQAVEAQEQQKPALVV
jgi:peptidoglycan hydrolase CwlO-like protein